LLLASSDVIVPTSKVPLTPTCHVRHDQGLEIRADLIRLSRISHVGTQCRLGYSPRSLRPFVVPKKIQEQACHCGRRSASMYLQTTGDLSRDTFVAFFRIQAHRPTLARPGTMCPLSSTVTARSASKDVVFWSRPWLYPLHCVARECWLKRIGKLVASVEEDPYRYGECALCGREKWWHPVAQFIGYGEQRRCIACSFHQTQQGEELDPGEWDPAKDPKASEHNGCAKCKEPEPASADAAKESSTFAYQVIYKRCHACYLYIWRHSCERAACLGGCNEGCGNCGWPEGGEKGWVEFGTARRCQPCNVWPDQHGGNERLAYLEAGELAKVVTDVRTQTVSRQSQRIHRRRKGWAFIGAKHRCSQCTKYENRWKWMQESPDRE
jgi:hypothetical protein